MRTLNFRENISPHFKHYIKRPRSCVFVIWSIQIISHSESLCVENSYICVIKCTGCFDLNYLVVCNIRAIQSNIYFPEVQLLLQEVYNKWILWQGLGISCRTKQYSLLSALSYGLLLTNLELAPHRKPWFSNCKRESVWCFVGFKGPLHKCSSLSAQSD